MPTTKATHAGVQSSTSNDAFLSNDLVLDIFDPAIDDALGDDAPYMEDQDLFDGLGLTESMVLPATISSMSPPVEVSEEEASTSGSTTSDLSSSVGSTGAQDSTALKKQQELDRLELMKSLPSKPKRSLSAYNLFFQAERRNLLEALPCKRSKKPRKSHGKCGFAEMARTISAKWKKITPQDKKYFDGLAAEDTARYEKEMAVWREQIKDFPELAKKTYNKKKKNMTTTPTRKAASATAKKARTATKSTTKKPKAINLIDDVASTWTPPVPSLVGSNVFSQMETV
eukprot:CAMPEP_0172445106 /NCGR_PEP_ID=MMETSP1065-20121228/5054_1 /TAXON_ID=265537 /ORGANISM="Amphiprora paludosa, Strain CCMP125" /LENGTH=284 /DNA_ID=CAMNT_0013195901 /DNA_START=60 /DNA_END=914 /DNA_ORIENTATION=-